MRGADPSGINDVTERSNIEHARRWAATLANTLGDRGTLAIVEPAHPHGGLVIDLELTQTLAQVILWPNGRMEIRALCVDTGEAIAVEHHEIEHREALAAVLEHVESQVVGGHWGGPRA